MPIYEYKCNSCDTIKEMILKPGEEIRPPCPACGKKMRRIISTTAFILKGAGWHVNDYPSQDRKKGMEAEKGPTTASKEPVAPAKTEADAGTKKTTSGTTPANGKHTKREAPVKSAKESKSTG